MTLGLNGPGLAACIFDGSLIVSGTFTRAHGLPALRIARWDDAAASWSAMGDGFQGSARALAVRDGCLIAGGDLDELYQWSGAAWTGMGVFNGPIHAIAIIGTTAYIAGRFDHAGGQAGNLCIVKWTGSNWITICEDITEPNDYPIIYALCAVGTDVYVGGCFDSIDGVAANGLARYDTVADTWSPCIADGINGVQGQVLSLAWNGADVFVGGQIMLRGTESACLWRWTPASSTWTKQENELSFTWTGPVQSLYHDGTSAIYAGVFGIHSGDSQMMWRIRKLSGGSWTTLPQDDWVFDGPVNAIVKGDAGDGARLFAVGGWTQAGLVTAWDSAGCMGIVKFRDELWHDFAGGVGLQDVIAGDYMMPGMVQCIRAVEDYLLHRPCRLVIVGGEFPRISSHYGRSAMGWSVRGPRHLQAGLLTSAMPPNPFYCFVDVDRQTMYFAGDVTGAINDHLFDEIEPKPDIDPAPQGIRIIRWRGLWWDALPELAHWCRAMARFDEQIIAACDRLYWLDEVSEPAEWAVLTEDFWPDGDMQALIIFEDDLWVAGWFGVGDPPEICCAAKWDGISGTPAHPADASMANALAVVGFAASNELVIGISVASGNPVRKWTGSDWDAGIGGTNLSGVCYSLAYNDCGADGKWLVAAGILNVIYDGTLYPCHVAGWDGEQWHPLLVIDRFDVAFSVAATQGQFGAKRFVLVGQFAQPWDPISEEVFHSSNILEWHPASGWTVPAWGGANGKIGCLAVNG